MYSKYQNPNNAEVEKSLEMMRNTNKIHSILNTNAKYTLRDLTIINMEVKHTYAQSTFLNKLADTWWRHFSANNTNAGKELAYI